MSAPSIVWFRQDLRLHDQAALVAACAAGPIIPVYILDDDAAGEKRMGGAQRWWLHHSLTRLAEALADKGATLILRRGDSGSILRALADQTGAATIHAIRHYEPWWQRIETDLAADGLMTLHGGNHLAKPSTILTGGGNRYRVFTPWWNNLLSTMPPPKPLAVPEAITGVPDIASDALSDWNLLPTRPNWATGFAEWTPGEEGARAALRAFLPKLKSYDTARNLPSASGISRLSPHHHFGEISPATVWHVATKEAGKAAEPFLREIGWRDYATNLIDQMPDYPDRNGKAQFDALMWRDGAQADSEYDAWSKGRTGYPIVDAGMRELWATGFMHNRVRMIVASFLTKHLLIDWRRGERWFWDTLLDADFGANAANWQWVAGTGVDAPMFSRIMAPLSQSEKFSAGDYIRRWVPELGGVSDPYVHDPDEFGARPSAYPAKIIGHREARERTLAAYEATRR
jgi:deoxyribodipyrimidine photo-lyase